MVVGSGGPLAGVLRAGEPPTKVRSCGTVSRWNVLPLAFRPRAGRWPLGSPLPHPCGGRDQRVWLSTTYRHPSDGVARWLARRPLAQHPLSASRDERASLGRGGIT